MENSPYVVAHRGIFMEMFEQASFILVDQFVHTYVQISIYVCRVGNFSQDLKYPQTLQGRSSQLCMLNIILSSSV